MGGNFLLNIGPTANGTVFHTMVDRLHDMGSWLDANGASLFEADPYWLDTQDKGVRYMMGHNASSFYILVLDRSVITGSNQLSLLTPLPLRRSSIISALGSNTTLSWNTDQDTTTGVTRWVINDIPSAMLDHHRYAWVFRCLM